MHELGVTENIINISIEKAREVQSSKITQINLVVGELSGFVADCLQFYFDILRKGTIAEAAALHSQFAPSQLRCRHCFTVFHPENNEWACPRCQSRSMEIAGGREFYIESIEVE